MSVSSKFLQDWKAPLDKRVVGGKFAHQSTMAKAGLPIPPFFCVAINAYREVFAHLQEKVESLLQKCDFSNHKSVVGTSQSIRTLFEGVPFPVGFEEAVLQSFDVYFGPDAHVSVRGSMVGYLESESEDSSDNPFAGMSDSFLYVRRADVLNRIRQSWSSGFSPEAMVYRNAQNMNLVGFATAVGVQKMIFGHRSFVMFTCDPKSAARDVLIVGGHGIGEGVVQEKVPVDHYFVRHRDGQVETVVAEKDKQLVFDAAAGHGLREDSVSLEKQKAPCFEEKEVLVLAELGRKVESIFGRPQDIEGTFTPEGQIFLLQARPVALDFRRMRVWSNANVTESFPGTSTVLTYSFARFFYDVIFYDCYRMLGISPRILRDNRASLEKMIGFVKNRVYYCLSSFYRLHSLSPLFPFFRKNWESMMGFRSSYVTSEGGLFSRLLDGIRSAFVMGGALIVIAYRYLTHERDMRRFFVWWERLMGPLRGKRYHDVDPSVALAEFMDVWTQVGNNWGVTLTNDTYLPMFHGTVDALFKKWGLDDDSALLSDLLCGDESLVSVEIILSAVRLAELVRGKPLLAAEFLKESPESLWERVENESLDSEFRAAFLKHLHVYGDRGFQELKLEQLTMRESPETLLRMIKGYVTSDATVAGFVERERMLRREAEERLSARLSTFSILILNFFLKRLRRFIRNRENSRYCRSELYGFSRAVFKGIGAQFAKTGVIEQPSDIFHLAQEEIFGFIDGTGLTQDLRALVAIRKREYEEHANLDTPIQFVSNGVFGAHAFPEENSLESSGTELRGLGSSPGVVRGRVRVVIDPSEPLGDTSDLILVARETDPGWLFLMLSSKGIIVERGSMLSHTAITGRKFGIPTIVALPDATRRIPDGALVEMDGARGVVVIVNEESHG